MNITCPLNPHTPDAKIVFEADAPLVTETTFIDWADEAPAAGVNRVSLKHFQAVKAFLPRCSIPRGGPAEVAASQISVLELRFPAATWKRVLEQLLESGLIDSLKDQKVEGVRGLHQAIANLDVATPQDLQLTAADLSSNGGKF